MFVEGERVKRLHVSAVEVTAEVFSDLRLLQILVHRLPRKLPVFRLLQQVHEALRVTGRRCCVVVVVVAVVVVAAVAVVAIVVVAAVVVVFVVDVIIAVVVVVVIVVAVFASFGYLLFLAELGSSVFEPHLCLF